MSNDNWYAEKDEVLLHKETEELYHVTARLYDIDRDIRRYELADDTHTTTESWYEEDLEDLFIKTSVSVHYSHKPLQRLDGRLYESGFIERQKEKFD